MARISKAADNGQFLDAGRPYLGTGDEWPGELDRSFFFHRSVSKGVTIRGFTVFSGIVKSFGTKFLGRPRIGAGCTLAQERINIDSDSEAWFVLTVE
jgi:hypothetical protein